MRNFMAFMKSVNDVERNLKDAREMQEIIWHKCCETPHDASQGLDYSQTITLTVREGSDIVKAFELLIDRLSCMEIK